ncbi:sorting nexin-9-like [Planococcus citri]|uniref:sorting nexin-9-like n=1 Tax=Planococcus citri TaxID=170843 RepID=UPI0031FA12C5
MIVKVLYDFDGQPGSAELTIRSGEVLTVTRQDIGEGWWEGTDQKGNTGLFPAAYVEAADNQDFWDDEWDDDSDGGAPPSTIAESVTSSKPALHSIGSNAEDSSAKRAPSVKVKPINKSSFAKSGSDSYITGTLQLSVPESEKVYILESEYGLIWNPVNEPYDCAVASPKKESKLKGLKSFIVYQLTPSFNNIQVSRRYKHFDWLHERLEEKFSLIPIPPLPDKQIAGRYEEQFIEHRKNQLQAFVDCVCRHPVLSKCGVWQHFLTCTDEKRWKAGKRKAERDELVGANYFFAIEAPNRPLGSFTAEQETESFSRYIHGMDVAIKNLSNVVNDQVKKWQTLYKREYQRIGHSFIAYGQAYGMEEQSGYSRAHVMEAIKETGHSYNEVGKLFDEQPKLDWEPLGDMLHIYKGIITAFPDILTIHKGALQKRRECDRLAAESKMDSPQLQEASKRTDNVSYALLAEMNHFHAEQLSEISKTFKSFLTQQIAFHKKIVDQLENALSRFE